MATADELLKAAAASSEETDEEILVANLDTRVIAIPTSLKILGVESDDDVKRLQFKIPRYYGEFDLINFDTRINFRSAKGTGDVYLVDDLTEIDSEHIGFSWLVDRSAFDKAGDVTFSICMKLFDDTGMVVKELNTTIATLPVLKGLETEKAVVENNPSAFDALLYRLYAIEAATGNGRNGYYSLVTVSENDDGVLFTIVNQDGEVIATVKHGKDGYTPVKGVDYWTTEDKAEIKSEAAEFTKIYVNSWAPRNVTVTLPTANWTDKQQTVAIEGVTADNVVVVSPDPAYENYKEYADALVRCVGQSEGSLTFECITIPDIDLIANVAIYYSDTSITKPPVMLVTDDGKGNVFITF